MWCLQLLCCTISVISTYPNNTVSWIITEYVMSTGRFHLEKYKFSQQFQVSPLITIHLPVISFNPWSNWSTARNVISAFEFWKECQNTMQKSQTRVKFYSLRTQRRELGIDKDSTPFLRTAFTLFPFPQHSGPNSKIGGIIPFISAPGSDSPWY